MTFLSNLRKRLAKTTNYHVSSLGLHPEHSCLGLDHF